MRFVMHCYVCEGGALHYAHNLGSCTLRQLLDARPVECRYAVVHQINGAMLLDRPQIMVIDMYQIVPDDFSELRLGAREIYPDLDTAIAATLLRLS
jgi:hypothetical protein